MSDRTSADEEDVQKTIRRIKNSEEITEENRELLMEYNDILRARRGSDLDTGRHKENLKVMLRVFAKQGFNLESLILPLESEYTQGLTDDHRRAMEELASIDQWVKEEYDSDATLDSYFKNLRTFVNALGDMSRIPRSSEYASTSHYNPRESIPSVDEILHYEGDVIPMIEARRELNLRDPAIIALQWASGGRPQSEIHKLKMREIEVYQNRVVLNIPEATKTGFRKRTIYTGVPYILEWLRNHPTAEMHENSDTPLWVKLAGDKSEIIGYRRYGDIFDDARDEAGIEKKANPRRFRKSRASVAAMREGYTVDKMRQVFGWRQGTNTPQYYVSKYGGEASNELAEIEGADVSESRRNKKIAPVKCPSCDSYTPRFRDTCLTCGTPIDPEEGKSAKDAGIDLDNDVNEAWDGLVKQVAEGELDEDDIDTAQLAATVAEKNPERISDLVDLLDALDDDDKDSSAPPTSVDP